MGIKRSALKQSALDQPQNTPSDVRLFIRLSSPMAGNWNNLLSPL